MVGFDLQQAFIDKSDHIFHIIFVYGFHGSVHIAQWEGDQSRRNSAIAVGKGIGICTGKPRGSHSLEGDLLFLCSSDDQLSQLILNRRSIGDHRAGTDLGLSLFFLIDHRGGGIVCNIGNDSYIRLDGLGDHFSSPQPDLFLYRVGDVEAEGEFLFVFLQQSGNLGDHKSAYSVIQGPAYKFVLVEYEEFIRVCDYAAYMNP